MAIFLKINGNTQSYSGSEVKGKLGDPAKLFAGVVPINVSSLIDQILTRYDFQNRRFASMKDFRRQLVADALEEATDVVLQEEDKVFGLDKADWTRSPFQSQFKAISIAKIGEMSFLRHLPKDIESSGLELEVRTLERIHNLGLRTVPVYGHVDKKVYQLCIEGSFMDLYKQDLTLKPPKGKFSFLQYYILGAFLGQIMPTGEAAFIKLPSYDGGFDEAIRKGLIPNDCIMTAFIDFNKIHKLMNVGHRHETEFGEITYRRFFISDLQGVLQLRTGKFFIIDPLAILFEEGVKKDEVRFMICAEKNLTAILKFLSDLLFRR